MTPDQINGIFETIGGVLCWLNVLKIQKDKCVKGTLWSVQIFFSSWGIWNLFYYPALDQWYSFLGGAFLVSGNATWTIFAAVYAVREKKQ